MKLALANTGITLGALAVIIGLACTPIIQDLLPLDWSHLTDNQTTPQHYRLIPRDSQDSRYLSYVLLASGLIILVLSFAIRRALHTNAAEQLNQADATSQHDLVREPDLMRIYDKILWLESQSTGRKFPTVLFTADTDMPTVGWISLTSTVEPEIVVTQLTHDEFLATALDPSAHQQVERRVNASLGRNDLKIPWLVRVEEQVQSNFEPYHPPRLFYRDILAPKSLSEKFSEVSRKEFEEGGGKVIVV